MSAAAYIFKFDAGDDWRHSSQLPDISVPDDEWNDAWEKLLPAMSPAKLLQERVNSQLRHPEDTDSRLSMHRSRLRELCYLQLELTVEARDAIVLNSFESKWLECGELSRRGHLLKGLKQTASISKEFGHVRMYCDELTLPRLQKDNGRGFLEILKGITHDDTTTVPNRPNFLLNAAWDVNVNHSTEEAQAQTIIAAIRGKFIGNCDVFFEFTMDSFFGLPPHVISLCKPEHAPTSGPRVMLEALLGKSRGKKVFRAANPDPPASKSALLCSNCHQIDKDLGDGFKFMVCKVCKEKINRRVYYCSAKCQKIDWNNRHKSICGKVLTLETAESSFTPYQHPPSKTGVLPPPERDRIGPSIATFKRSMYLTFQISLLNEYGNADYFLRDGDEFRVVDFPLDRLEGRAERFYFRKCRQLAMTTGEQFVIAVLAQTLCDSSTESKVVTRELILKQIAQEFEWDGLADAVERLDGLKASGRPRGLTLLLSRHRGWISEFREQERQR